MEKDTNQGFGGISRSLAMQIREYRQAREQPIVLLALEGAKREAVAFKVWQQKEASHFRDLLVQGLYPIGSMFFESFQKKMGAKIAEDLEISNPVFLKYDFDDDEFLEFGKGRQHH